jgi:hypothetical protein
MIATWLNESKQRINHTSECGPEAAALIEN